MQESHAAPTRDIKGQTAAILSPPSLLMGPTQKLEKGGQEFFAAISRPSFLFDVSDNFDCCAARNQGCPAPVLRTAQQSKQVWPSTGNQLSFSSIICHACLLPGYVLVALNGCYCRQYPAGKPGCKTAQDGAHWPGPGSAIGDVSIGNQSSCQWERYRKLRFHGWSHSIISPLTNHPRTAHELITKT